jgi:hypothetical protein
VTVAGVVADLVYEPVSCGVLLTPEVVVPVVVPGAELTLRVPVVEVPVGNVPPALEVVLLLLRVPVGA